MKTLKRSVVELATGKRYKDYFKASNNGIVAKRTRHCNDLGRQYKQSMQYVLRQDLVQELVKRHDRLEKIALKHERLEEIEMNKGIENDTHYNNYSTCYKMIKKLESTITELGFTICFDDNFERVIRSL